MDNNSQLLKAMLIAARAHNGQQRADKNTAYIIHPLRVATLVDSATCWQIQSERTLAVTAALLHDVLEDSGTTAGSTPYSREDLTREFGEAVVQVVVELTQDSSLPKPERKAKMIDHCGQMSRVARVIKLADRLDNMRDMSVKDDAFIKDYCAAAAKMIVNMKGSYQPFEQEIQSLISDHEKRMERKSC